MSVWVLLLGAFLLALLGTSGQRPTGRLLLLILVAGGLARLSFLTGAPQGSDDLYRYLFEGRVLCAGEDPYRFPPDSPRLISLRDTSIHPHVNHPAIPTIYLPVAEGLFLLANLLGGSIPAWKALLLALELTAAAGLGLYRLRSRKSLLPVVLFFWNPLLLLESAEGGHVDAAGASLLLLALTALQARRPAKGSCLALAATLIKPVSAPLLLFFCRTRRGLLGLLLAGMLGSGMLIWILLPPGHGLDHPDPKGRLFAADGRAALLLTEEGGTRFFRQNPHALQIEADPKRDARAFLGRYHLGLLHQRQPPLTLRFDGQQQAEILGFKKPLRASFYVQKDGSVVVWQRATKKHLLQLQMSMDREVLKGTAWPPVSKEGPRPALALKGAESPFMGFRQYFGRWAGWSPLHNLLRPLFNDPNLYRLATALLLIGLALLLFLLATPPPLAALILSLLAVAALPILLPWYLLWLLPGAVLLPRPLPRTLAALSLAALPLLHLLTG